MDKISLVREKDTETWKVWLNSTTLDGVRNVRLTPQDITWKVWKVELELLCDSVEIVEHSSWSEDTTPAPLAGACDVCGSVHVIGEPGQCGKG